MHVRHKIPPRDQIQFMRKHPNTPIISWIMYNSEDQYGAFSDEPYEWIVQEIIRELRRINPYFQTLQQMGSMPDQDLVLSIRGGTHHS